MLSGQVEILCDVKTHQVEILCDVETHQVEILCDVETHRMNCAIRPLETITFHSEF